MLRVETSLLQAYMYIHPHYTGIRCRPTYIRPRHCDRRRRSWGRGCTVVIWRCSIEADGYTVDLMCRYSTRLPCSGTRYMALLFNVTTPTIHCTFEPYTEGWTDADKDGRVIYMYGERSNDKDGQKAKMEEKTDRWQNGRAGDRKIGRITGRIERNEGR